MISFMVKTLTMIKTTIRRLLLRGKRSESLRREAEKISFMSRLMTRTCRLPRIQRDNY